MNNSSFNSFCAMENGFEKTEGIEAISLFDGMSCGQIAIQDLGIKVKTYYASEIDKFAITQTQLNFSNTIQLSDIENWQQWNINWSQINLILAGSPCQGFSFAGKQLNFNDPRSKLFFVFVDILNHCKKFNPNVKFLLENVNMKKEHQRVINNMLGLFPVRINSNLVSAQNRDRLYWTNIKIKMIGLFNEIHSDIPQPRDRNILLKDILQPENEINKKYYLNKDIIIRGIKQAGAKKWKSGNRMGNMDFPNNIEKKAKTLTVVQTAGGRETNHISIYPVLNDNGNLRETEKANCIDANYFKGLDNHAQRSHICCSTPKRNDYGKKVRKQYESGELKESRHNMTNLEPRGDEKTNTLSTVQKDNLLTNGYKLRRLTPLECSRLQTVPAWYKWNCSDTQQYKMLGNGWTIEVIKHIFSFLLPIGQSAEEKLLKRQKPTKFK